MTFFTLNFKRFSNLLAIELFNCLNEIRDNHLRVLRFNSYHRTCKTTYKIFILSTSVKQAIQKILQKVKV